VNEISETVSREVVLSESAPKNGGIVEKEDGSKVLPGYGSFNGKAWFGNDGEEISPPKPLACFIEDISPTGLLTVTFN